MSYLLALFSLSVFWACIVQTQKNFAVCTDDSYKWASDLPLPGVNPGLLTL